MTGPAPRIGFCTADLKGTFEEELPWHDPLEARILYACGQNDTSVWIALDLMQPSRGVTDYLRKALSEKLRIDPAQVITHATHTHSAPADDRFEAAGLDRLSDRLLEACVNARQSARECEMACVETTPLERISVRRRARLEGIGDITSFTHFEDLNGVPDGLVNLRERVGRWSEHLVDHLAQMKSFAYDREVDEEIQFVVFRDLGGEIMGSIIRFAAHPHITHLTTERRYSADFPHYARTGIEEALGGTAIYFNGPHGDISPWERHLTKVDVNKERLHHRLGVSARYVNAGPRGAWGEAERIGRMIADSALSAYDSQLPFRPLTCMRAESTKMRLPVRRDLEPDIDIAHRKRDTLLAELEERCEAGASLAEVKALVDRINHYRLQPLIFDAYDYLDREEFKRGKIEIVLSALRLNSTVLLGIPGEVFFATGRSIKQSLRDEARNLRVITISEINGDIGYLPTPSDIAGGDYEANCSIIDERGEPAIVEAASRLLERM